MATCNDCIHNEMCYGTHYCEDRRCRMETAVNALGFISRQQAEIERLQNDLNVWKNIAKRETNHVSIAKSKAVKEFAERLKEKAITYYAIRGCWVSVKDIDNLVKEMVGEEE